jgi:phospholipid transport system substrate-binding protein
MTLEMVIPSANIVRRHQGASSHMDSHRRIFAKFALASSIALGGLLSAAVNAPAYAASDAALPRDQGAETFVQAKGQRLITILADKSQSTSDKMSAFRGAVDDIADVPTIAKFVLGKYGNSITSAQMQKFLPVFQDYVQNMLLQHLSDFHADTLTVKSSGAKAPGDVLVKTTLTGPNAKPSELDWRVVGSGSSWKVTDVQISGGSFAWVLRSDFVSTLDDQGGSIDALIARLQNEAHHH